MSIVYDAAARTLTLNTRSSSYQMQIGPLGYLLHTYYGRRAEGNFGPLHLKKDVGFSPVPYELAGETRGFSPDTLPQELSGANAGDFRTPAVCASLPDGRRIHTRFSTGAGRRRGLARRYALSIPHENGKCKSFRKNFYDNPDKNLKIL